MSLLDDAAWIGSVAGSVILGLEYFQRDIIIPVVGASNADIAVLLLMIAGVASGVKYLKYKGIIDEASEMSKLTKGD